MYRAWLITVTLLLGENGLSHLFFFVLVSTLSLILSKILTDLLSRLVYSTIMDWIYIALFKAPRALYIEPPHSHHIRTGEG